MSIHSSLQQWESAGQYLEIGPFRHKVFTREIGDPSADPSRTLLLLHGFPESSFSYHAIVEGMAKQFSRIVLFDMLGYGRSDKPLENYTYSLFEQADLALQVWQKLGVKGGHLLAHDMGVSVTTELVARHVGNILPEWFSQGLLSLTFTNGSLVLGMAKLRITQKILLSRYGHLMKSFTTYKLFRNQVKSAHGNDKLSEEAIQGLWEGNRLQDGHRKAYLTIKYLNDRKRFEKPRWLPALKEVELPIHLCWGDQDAVARLEMVHYVKKNICPSADLTVMEGVGHFCQLGSPEVWVESVGRFYRELS